MKVQESITAKITADLEPLHLEVINESHKHRVPPGSESHFKVVVVSDRFEGKRLVQRHQAVNAVLERELKEDIIHALSLETLTGAEWTARGGQTLASPPCAGGSKAGG
ncbi:MAG: BolA/IbaG family iron-sulfur metabolism protein [Rhodospirillales bacterium]|nr:BolA/IbaG family iron-sulfur metabolism protein [Rhodospirillales bacterium]MDH3912397.1 BolA/IbaG family iron-sulfur metabolism protein [Rhodospirillales bacterium]MDH3918992.1 BolA/IbaG family iron-sulfur metabolism protein [Rhodospirillales bacterium]MDH3969767.1 BolA/IbaG family iron-sulfur metabolism protein [Rhodospirillales bacterium]